MAAVASRGLEARADVRPSNAAVRSVLLHRPRGTDATNLAPTRAAAPLPFPPKRSRTPHGFQACGSLRGDLRFTYLKRSTYGSTYTSPLALPVKVLAPAKSAFTVENAFM